MSKRTSIISAFGIVLCIVILCSNHFAGMAGSQMIPQNDYGSYGGTNQGYGQQMPYAGGNAGTLTIPGIAGLQGFATGQNRLSLAIVPVQQQNSMMGFQVIGFAISGPGNSQAIVYSLSTPLAGVIDPAQNTLQVDLSGLDSSVSQSGYVAADQVYNIIRSGPQVLVIDVDMAYQGTQGTQTIFGVGSVDLVAPDGKMQAFSMQQPTQLIIDSQSMRLYMVVFPQMISAFGSFYGASYSQVLPVVYAQPIPILAPIFVPYLQPFPIFFGFISFNPFFFPSGFRPFPRPHPTGLITPTPHFPTGHPTGLITPTPHFPTGHPTGLLPTGHPTGLLPTDHQTGLLPSDHQTGLLPADNFPSGRLTPPSDLHVPSGFNGDGMPLSPAGGNMFNMHPGGIGSGNIGLGAEMPSFGGGIGGGLGGHIGGGIGGGRR